MGQVVVAKWLIVMSSSFLEPVVSFWEQPTSWTKISMINLLLSLRNVFQFVCVKEDQIERVRPVHQWGMGAVGK
jgi:hypothetical protein